MANVYGPVDSRSHQSAATAAGVGIGMAIWRSSRDALRASTNTVVSVRVRILHRSTSANVTNPSTAQVA
jgi:hypothetical protein